MWWSRPPLYPQHGTEHFVILHRGNNSSRVPQQFLPASCVLRAYSLTCYLNSEPIFFSLPSFTLTLKELFLMCASAND